MPADEPEDYRDRYQRLTGVSLRDCPQCKHGRMICIETLLPSAAGARATERRLMSHLTINQREHAATFLDDVLTQAVPNRAPHATSASRGPWPRRRGRSLEPQLRFAERVATTRRGTRREVDRNPALRRSTAPIQYP